MNQITHRETWFEKQKRRKKNPFFRLLNRSFGFRLLIASGISLAILGLVNRFEVCHSQDFTKNCSSAALLDVISVGNVESFSIVTAALMYILESSKRKQRANFEALEIINLYQSSGVVHSLARIEALEMLSETGVYLDHLDVQGANLDEIVMPYARLKEANLSKTTLLNADLRYTDLEKINLSYADLTNADLTGANLQNANLTGANLTRTNLTEVNLTDANLTDVDLTVTNLDKAILSTHS
jgi:uncharacterized protein YjbI with pentapeptide repeats